jgi:hypothetical protein
MLLQGEIFEQKCAARSKSAEYSCQKESQYAKQGDELAKSACGYQRARLLNSKADGDLASYKGSS